MVKLYYTPTSCGAASFIVAHSLGLIIECEQVNLGKHETASGADFFSVNPKGNVPALVLDDGTVLNEGAAVLQWLGDQKPGVLPAPKTTERYLVQQALNWVASELHAACGPLFAPGLSPEVSEFLVKRLADKCKKLNDLGSLLGGGKKFLVGDSFTVADSYCYIVLSWAPYLKVDLTAYPNVKAYFDGIAALPNVKAAHARMAESPATVV